jgi:hypothetical protein
LPPHDVITIKVASNTPARLMADRIAAYFHGVGCCARWPTKAAVAYTTAGVG